MRRRIEAQIESDTAPSPAWNALAALFGAGVRLRGHAYESGLLRSHAAPIPVVSVGGLTVGGAGKTPLVAWLASHLAGPNRRIAVLTRGYQPRGEDGPPDEPTMLREQLGEGTPVLIDPDRVRGAHRAAEQGAQLLILDDGFQHRRLRRDLDIVALDASNPFGNGALLPAGPLREPRSALRRAQLLAWIHRGPGPEAQPPDLPVPVQRFRTHPVGLRDLETGLVAPPDALDGAELSLISGIARPGAFRRSVEALGARILEHRALPDHAPISLADLRRLPGDHVICTEKDVPRLPSPLPRSVHALISRLRPEPNTVAVDAALAPLIERLDKAPAPLR